MSFFPQQPGNLRRISRWFACFVFISSFFLDFFTSLQSLCFSLFGYSYRKVCRKYLNRECGRKVVSVGLKGIIEMLRKCEISMSHGDSARVFNGGRCGEIVKMGIGQSYTSIFLSVNFTPFIHIGLSTHSPRDVHLRRYNSNSI